VVSTYPDVLLITSVQSSLSSVYQENRCTVICWYCFSLVVSFLFCFEVKMYKPPGTSNVQNIVWFTFCFLQIYRQQDGKITVFCIYLTMQKIILKLLWLIHKPCH